MESTLVLEALPTAKVDSAAPAHPEDTSAGATGSFHGLKDMEAQTPAGEDPERSEEPPLEATTSKAVLSDQTNLLPLKQLLVVCTGLACSLFCALLDQTIVSTALPTIGRVFNDASIAPWVGTAYLLTSTAFQPIYGRVSDIFGRKAVLLFCMSTFLLGSILCAVSQTMIMLIICRAVAGIGGGGIQTTVMIIVSDLVTLDKRGKYQGFFGVILSVATTLGPLIGGLFTEHVSWRWCFYINIPLTCITIIVVVFLLPQKPLHGNMKARLKKVDYLGSIVVFASVLLIMIALSWGGAKYAWDSAAVLAPLIIGCALFLVFIVVEMKFAALPLIPMHLFRNPTVVGVSVGAFLGGIATYSVLYYLPQFYQVVRGASPTRSGILLLPLSIQIYSSLVAGFVVSKTGKYKPVLYFGFGIWVIACGLFTTVSPDISEAKTIGYQLLSGVGAGATLQTTLVAIQASVNRNEMAVATGMRNFMRLIGGTVSLAACSAILNNTVRTELSGQVAEGILEMILSDPTQIRSLNLTPAQQADAILAYSHGIRNIFYLGLACIITTFFSTAFLVKTHSLKREDDAKLKAEGRAKGEDSTGSAL
ncbi:putative tetracycline efflux protein [Naematelia encephala]|uniref:Putative tetracycline efflux protein n=1 Tax=Naematelia encephala TaxID=71784 RepID=A0A1Y2BJL1_9TREE|nr:putative tetracycline efflux protein [Naematelia encephala]